MAMIELHQPAFPWVLGYRPLFWKVDSPARDAGNAIVVRILHDHRPDLIHRVGVAARHDRQSALSGKAVATLIVLVRIPAIEALDKVDAGEYLTNKCVGPPHLVAKDAAPASERVGHQHKAALLFDLLNQLGDALLDDHVL